MKKIILSYLIPYAITVGITFVLWLGLIWFYNGWMPVLAGILFVTSVVVTIPYLLYEDYKRVKNIVVRGYEAYHDNTKRDSFYEMMVTEIVTVAGVPDFVAEWGVKRAMTTMKMFSESVVA